MCWPVDDNSYFSCLSVRFHHRVMRNFCVQNFKKFFLRYRSYFLLRNPVIDDVDVRLSPFVLLQERNESFPSAGTYFRVSRQCALEVRVPGEGHDELSSFRVPLDGFHVCLQKFFIWNSVFLFSVDEQQFDLRLLKNLSSQLFLVFRGKDLYRGLRLLNFHLFWSFFVNCGTIEHSCPWHFKAIKWWLACDDNAQRGVSKK